MAVPTLISDLSPTLASNSPAGSDIIGTTMDDYIRAAYGFIAQQYAAVQPQTYTAFTTGGTSTAYTLTPTPATTANTTNQRFRVKFNAASGATPTLAVSGQTAKSLKYYDSTGAKQAITSTQVPINWISDVEYDGTDWVVLQPLSTGLSGGQLLKYTKITSTNASWAKQSGTNRIVVCCKGGGGAGGGCSSASTSISLGGAAGTIAWGESSSLTATFVATIGAGGTGVVGAAGNSGGTTSFTTSTPTTIASAVGGRGGPVDYANRAVVSSLGGNGESGEGVGGLGTNGATGGSAAANSAAGGGGCSEAAVNRAGGNGGSGVIHVWEYA